MCATKLRYTSTPYYYIRDSARVKNNKTAGFPAVV